MAAGAPAIPSLLQDNAQRKWKMKGCNPCLKFTSGVRRDWKCVGAEESELMMLAVALYNYLATMQVVEINLVF